MNLTLDDFQAIWPALGLCCVILVVVLWDALVKDPQHKLWGGHVGALALVGLVAASVLYPPEGTAFFGVYVADDWSLFLQRAVWGLGAIAMLGGNDRGRRVTPHRQGEGAFMTLVSLLGATLLFGARDLILLVVCFELMGIPLFVLAALDKQDQPGIKASYPAEAAMKFFMMGVVSTPIALLGASFLIGLSGSTNIAEIAQAQVEPATILGLVLVIAGMGFKIGVVPFHMWVPDTYQAAPTPFVAFLSTVPKIAGVAALSRILLFGYGVAANHWVPIVLALCVATLVLGNFWALAQSNSKRLLAYSGIGHIGYVLMGLLVVNHFGLQMLLFYLVGYGVTNLGAFLVLEAMETDGGEGTVSDLNGLWSRSPWLALSMLLFLLSLAGIPFVVGFWAKFYMFIAVWRGGYPWLVVLGALIAVVSLFYYLQMARAMYMTKPSAERPLTVSPSLKLAIVACTLGVVGLGLYPNPLLEQAEQASANFIASH